MPSKKEPLLKKKEQKNYYPLISVHNPQSSVRFSPQRVSLLHHIEETLNPWENLKNMYVHTPAGMIKKM